MRDVNQPTTDELLAALAHLQASPLDEGPLELIVSRPTVDERVVLTNAELRVEDGLVGDTWRQRGSRNTEDGSAEIDRQLTLMNARAIALFAGERSRWPLAGDQLYVDLNLSEDNLPAGTQLRLGTAVLEVTALPHTGCAKFRERFGLDVSRFINSDEGRRLNLRGINARVVSSGTIRTGDTASAVR